MVRRALESLEDGRPRVLVLGEHDSREGVEVVPMACESEGAMEVYLEPVLPTPELVVVGDSPMVVVLVEMAAVLGWRSRSVDSPDLGAVGEGGFVVVATQGHYDEPALKAALAAPAAFIGLVASGKRASSVLEALRAEGMDEEQLARVRAPAGLDLGHTTHEEVAVAVLAELVALARRQRCPSAGRGAPRGGDRPGLRDGGRPGNRPVLGGARWGSPIGSAPPGASGGSRRTPSSYLDMHPLDTAGSSNHMGLRRGGRPRRIDPRRAG